MIFLSLNTFILKTVHFISKQIRSFSRMCEKIKKVPQQLFFGWRISLKINYSPFLRHPESICVTKYTLNEESNEDRFL